MQPRPQPPPAPGTEVGAAADEPPADPADRADEPSGAAPAGGGAAGRPVLRPAALRGAADRLRPHAIPLPAYAAVAGYVMHRLLLHPYGQVIGQDTADQTTFEWMLTAVAHQLVHLHNPLFSSAMGAPQGVNLMANPSVPLYGALFAPLTLWAGAPVTFVLLLAGNLFATACAWYWFFLRHPAVPAAHPGTATRRAAAAVGGALCGFSPAMITHSNGHPNLTSQWLIPVIVDRLSAPRSPGRPAVRAAAVTGLLVAAQTLIAEELVFIAALALGILAALHVLTRPKRSVRQHAAALRAGALAGAVAVAALAYPLWFQFAGPQSYKGFWWHAGDFGANAESYLSFSRWTVGGGAGSAALAPNITEESAFLGWPVLLMAAVIVVRRLADPAVRNTALTAAIVAVLSLGVAPRFGTVALFGHHHGPWKYLTALPLFADALPVRLAFAVFPLIGYILVAGLGRLGGRPRARMAAVGVCTAAAFAPLFPLPVPTIARPPAPAFYAGGLWRQCAVNGGSLVAFPGGFTAMRWSVAAGTGFPLAGGIFFGPGTGREVTAAPPSRPTADLLAQVDQSGRVPVVTAATRARAHTDLLSWKADCVVLFSAVPNRPGTPLDGADVPLLHPVQDRELLTELFGPGRFAGGVWSWPVGR